MNAEARTHCPNCGHEEFSANRFCTECGGALPAVPAPAARCSGCAQPLASGLRFCTNCGTPVEAPPTAMPPPPALPATAAPPGTASPQVAPQAHYPPGLPAQPGPHPGARRRRAWPWVLVAALVLVLVAGGGTAWFLHRDDSDATAGVAQDRADEGTDADSPGQNDEADDEADHEVASAAPSESPGPSGSGEPAPPATSSASPTPSGTTCWDGTATADVDQCSRPQGVAGLAYVFPNLSSQNCKDITGSGDAVGRKVLMQCFVSLPDGTPVKINYSQWTYVAAAREHYTGKGMTEADGGSLYTFAGVARDGQPNHAWVYRKEPFSASLYAPDQAALDEAVATLINARPADQVRGQQAQ